MPHSLQNRMAAANKAFPIAFLLAATLCCITTLFSGFCQGEGLQSVENRVIVVGGDYNYPPHEFLNESSNPDGYNVDMTKAIAKVMGFEVKIVLGPWDELRDKLKNGEIDIIQGILKSSERETYLDFSAPYTIISQSIFARKGGRKNISVIDLRNREVIVQRNGFMEEYLRQISPETVFIEVDTHVDALRLLAAGKHDYAVVAVPLGIYLQKKYQLSNIEPVSAPLTNAQYCYAVQKGNTEILKLFSSGLAILVNTGTQQELHAKWLGGQDTGPARLSLLLRLGTWVLTPLLLIIIGVVIWNNALKRRVAERTRELEDRQQQLIQADKLASLGILTSGVAHEINTPNGIILMNMPVLIEAWEDASVILDKHLEEQGDFPFGGLSYRRLRHEFPAMLADMADGARRIRQIVTDLKAYARPEEAGEAVELDLNEMVGNAVRLADVSIRKATHRSRMEYAPDLPPVLGNPQRLTQVAVNLIVNACQAIDSPDKAIEVITRYDQTTGNAIFTVSDEGLGILPEHLPRLTDPFFTTKRETGGTGLGLSVSLSIVKEHGGDLTFESVPGLRTTVTVTLPTAGTH
ncbi:MAG: transporter substrate-binding domain-containing protein [Proteobacteria bacterium]|nr:transporter substrate-binding domain-containing protein [Pseudomonadota bacterium]